MVRPPSIARVVMLLATAVVTVACASGGGVAVVNPGPFPSAPSPTSAEAVLARHLDEVIKTAVELKGTRYRLGGESPTAGFDCSGFVRYVYVQHHVELPRTVASQYQSGRRVPLDQLRKGDLLFFSTTGKGPTHVGIALGADRAEFVHAPGSGGSVRIERFDSAYWRGKLLGVRRVVS